MSDNDVKIYHSKSELNRSKNDLSVAFDAVIAHRTNGNIDKATKPIYLYNRPC